MSDPAEALQNAIETALRADAGVKAQFAAGVTAVYTMTAPNNAPFPYITIGEDQVVGDDTECAEASEVISTVHIHAREPTPAASRLKAKALAGAVRAALTRKLVLAGHVMDDWMFEGALHLTEPDGLTAHAVLTFNYQTTAV